MAIYELFVIGEPSAGHLKTLETTIRERVAEFGLTLGKEVLWTVNPAAIQPNGRRASAVVVFGGMSKGDQLRVIAAHGIPVIPVASSLAAVSTEVPEGLRALNCIGLREASIHRVATALLEAAGLLSRDRRVFLSYRRSEAKAAAVQLFEAFSGRGFDVFLDTHDVLPGEEFQIVLWHRLCDSDVVVMLDTPGYFNSRWTEEEFGRALAKGIAVLRVGWPDSTPDPRTATCSRAELVDSEVRRNGRLSKKAVDRLCGHLERVRSQSQAVRLLNLVGGIRDAVERIGGQFMGVGPRRIVHLILPGGTPVVAWPTVGVPTSRTLHEAVLQGHGHPTAVVYDPVGLHPDWQRHLNWLEAEIHAARWLRSSELGWQLAGWTA